MDSMPPCPVILTSRILGGRWTAKIVHLLLRHDALRYSELRKGCPPISDRILSMELKALQQWHLVSRRDYGTIPPRTDYRLTELGQTLRPVIDAMVAWGHLAQARLAQDGDAQAER